MDKKELYIKTVFSINEDNLLRLFSVLPEINLAFNDILEFSYLKKKMLKETLTQLTENNWLETDKKQDTFKINNSLANVIREKNSHYKTDTFSIMFKKINHILENTTNINLIAFNSSVDSEMAVNYLELAPKYVEYAEIFLPFIKKDTIDTLRLYENLGNYFSINDIEKALDYYEQFNKLYKNYCAENKDDIDAKYQFAISYSKLAETHLEIGNSKKALFFYEKSTKLFNEIYKIDNDSFYKTALYTSFLKLSEIHYALGDTEKSIKYEKKYLSFLAKLYKNDSQNFAYKNRYALYNYRLGLKFASIGKYEKALTLFVKSTKLYKALSKADPNDTDIKKSLADSYDLLGLAYRYLEKTDLALKSCHKAHDTIKELTEKEPNNLDFKIELGLIYARLGGIYRLVENWEKALVFYEKDLTLSQEMYKNNPENDELKDGLAFAYQSIAKIYVSMNETKKALRYFNKSNKIFKDNYKQNPTDEYKENLINSNSKLIEIHNSMGNKAKATTLLKLNSKLYLA